MLKSFVKTFCMAVLNCDGTRNKCQINRTQANRDRWRKKKNADTACMINTWQWHHTIEPFNLNVLNFGINRCWSFCTGSNDMKCEFWFFFLRYCCFCCCCSSSDTMNANWKARMRHFNVMYGMFLNLILKEYVKSRLSFWATKFEIFHTDQVLLTSACIKVLVVVDGNSIVFIIWINQIHFFPLMKEHTHFSALRIKFESMSRYLRILMICFPSSPIASCIDIPHTLNAISKAIIKSRYIFFLFVFQKCVISIQVKSW